jgi:hypothetical protein
MFIHIDLCCTCSRAHNRNICSLFAVDWLFNRLTVEESALPYEFVTMEMGDALLAGKEEADEKAKVS